MKFLFLLFASFTFAHECSDSFKTALYSLERGEIFREITDRVYEESFLPEGMKTKLRQQKRRFFVFSFPSCGFQIRSMVSFVDRPGPKPLIVYLRGGSRMHALPCFGCLDYPDFFACQCNATIVLGTYRDGVSPGVDEYGGCDVDDVFHLCRFIPHLCDILQIEIDTSRRCMIGISRGGMQMFLALARFPKLCFEFNRFVSLCGILDLDRFICDNPDFRKKIEKDFRFHGSQKWIDHRNPLLCAPLIPDTNLQLLLIQGTLDQKVCLQQGIDMVARMRECGFCNVNYWEFAGGNHGLKNRPECIPLMLEWLNCSEPFPVWQEF